MLLVSFFVFASIGSFGPAAVGASAETLTREVVFGGFEAEEGWTLSLGSEFPGAQGDFVRDPESFRSGARSGKLTGNFAGGGNYVALTRTLPAYEALELSFWVKTSDVSRLGFRMTDATGQVHQQRISLQSTSDWQRISISVFDGGTQYSHWGGANDGVWHSPAKQISFVFDRSALTGGKNSGVIRFDDVVMTATVPDLELQQDRPGNVFAVGEPVSLRALTSGDSVVSAVYDYWGNPVSVQTDPTGGGYANIALAGLESGYYTVNVTALRGGSPLREATTSLAVLPPFDLGAVPDSPFGMATHFGQSWNPDLLPLLQKAGTKNIRDEMYWGSVEKPKGTYAFAGKFETYMAGAEANAIKPLIVLTYENPFYDNNSTPYSDEGREGYANYGRAVAEHFEEQIEWVEVYNEFNIGFGDRGDGPADSKPEHYYELLKKTYETIKAARPEVTVAGAATAGIPLNWLEDVFSRGGLDYMDVVSVHPYRYPGAPEGLADALADLQALIMEYNGGRPKPIWITEIGWPTQADARGVSESRQAEYIVRSHVVALASGVEKLFWYDFMNDGVNETYNEHNFGIVRNAEDPKGKYAPKPAYVSYATMTRQLTGKAFSHREPIGEGIHSYLFEGAVGAARVVWSTEPKQAKIETDAPVKVTDLMGTEDTLYPLNGYVYLTLTESPVYIEGAIGSISEGSKFALTGSLSATGAPLAVSLAVDNSEPPRGRIQAQLSVEGAVYDIDVMPHETAVLDFTVPGRDTPQTKTVTGYIVRNGNKVGKLRTEVEIANPVRLAVKHVRVDGQDKLRLNVANSLDEPIEMSGIEWRIGERSGTEALSVPIPAGAAGGTDLPVPALPAGETYGVQLKLNFENAPSSAFEGKIRLAAEEDMKPFPLRAVNVDGQLDDFAGVAPIDLAGEGEVEMNGYAGADDLSGNIWGTWDDENFYLSASVRDDVFSQTAAGETMWQGDSIQFAVSQGMPGERGQWFEYGMALTGSGPQLYRWIADEGLHVGLVENARIAVTRNEETKETVYELALPWTELAPALPEDGLLGFSVLVNDNDVQGRKGWIEWGGGIGGSKDGGLFKAIRLERQP